MPTASELVGRLTREQSAMLHDCLALEAAWTTSTSGANYELLRGWEDRGWVRSVPPPSGLHSLASFQFTDAGRTALADLEPKP
jgi:hypothetical protein